MGNKEGKLHIFRAVRLDMPCLLFFKTELPVDPADFVHRICEEIITKPNVRRMRYINRLTPMSCIGKATERGLEEVGRAVLAKHFQLSGEETRGEDTQSSYSVSAFDFTPAQFTSHAFSSEPQSTTVQGSRPLGIVKRG